MPIVEISLLLIEDYETADWAQGTPGTGHVGERGMGEHRGQPVFLCEGKPTGPTEGIPAPVTPVQMPESNPVPEVESVVVNGEHANDRKRHKKDKKHKKEKKHKRQKERRRSKSAERPSEVVEQEATQTAALDVDVAQGDLLAEARATTAHSTPESGEIGDPQGSLTFKENTVQSSSDRAPALKHKIARPDVSPRKRHKAGEGQDPVQSHNVDSSPKNGLAGPLPPPPSRNEVQRVEPSGHRTESRAGADRRDDRRPRSRQRDDSRSRARSPARRSDSARHDTRPRSRARSRDTARSEGRYRDDRERRREYGRSDDRRPREESRGRRRSASRDGQDRSRKPEERKNRRSGSEEKEDKEFAAKVIAKLEGNEEDEDALIEQRRKRRQELLAKLQQEQDTANAVARPTASELSKQPFPIQQAQDPPSERVATSAETANGSAEPLQGDNPITRASSPSEAVHEHAGSEAQRENEVVESDTEDEEVPEATEEQLFQQRKERLPDEEEHPAALTPQESSDERHKIQNQEKKQKLELDMFAAVDVEDMFGDEPVCAPAAADAPKRGLLDNYDDSEGYYNFQVGEIMDDRYEVFATHGKGVFSTVLRARDRKPTDEKGPPNPAVRPAFPEVAIKVIRANDIMSKAGQAEVVILRKLAGADPSNKYHIIRLLRTFEYRHHLCLVFEPLESNLRQLTKKYGQGIGLRLDAVRSMAAQMLMALHLMRQCGVLHADIKPDNILINKGHNIVKMCDFGSAMFTGNNEITPYLVSRFYRAPEIILGLHYDHPMDVWSIGCVIFELFTGRILFPGRTNNEMLKLMMDAKGPFPKKMLKKGEFTLQHFEDDPNMSFCQMEIDPLTKRPAKRLVPNPTIKKDFRGLLAGQEGDSKQVASLVDLLEKMMHLDPEKRLTAKEALRHPFIKDGRQAARA